MSNEPDLNTLSAVATIKSEVRRAKLLEKAKGHGPFSWLDLVFVLPLVVFGYIAFSGRNPFQLETHAMATVLIMIVQWSVLRLTIRLNALIQFLLEQPTRQDAQQGTPADSPNIGAPLS